jgi:hypothetical protein
MLKIKMWNDNWKIIKHIPEDFIYFAKLGRKEHLMQEFSRMLDQWFYEVEKQKIRVEE